MDMIERMRQAKDRGALCTSCGASAVDCQVRFLETNQREWCCSTCRVDGPQASHTNRPP